MRYLCTAPRAILQTGTDLGSHHTDGSPGTGSATLLCRFGPCLAACRRGVEVGTAASDASMAGAVGGVLRGAGTVGH